jgi:hypothetical protein
MGRRWNPTGELGRKIPVLLTLPAWRDLRDGGGGGLPTAAAFISGRERAGWAAMTSSRLSNPVVRRVLRSLALWSLGQLAILLVGRLVARRLDRGDETSSDIRRVYLMSGEELRPTSPGLSRVRVDAVMGGAQLDLTALPPSPAGIDVVVRTLMGGVAVRVPKGWTAWWSYRGAMGGVGADGGVQRVTDPARADVRVRARAVMGGVGIESAEN